MTQVELDKLRFPIGDINLKNVEFDLESIKNQINTIKSFSGLIKNEIKDVSENELSYVYRPGGWNIIELVNHCVDSHMNAFIRFKLALTSINPTIIPYDEAKWVQLNDTNINSIKNSISLLDSLHVKWVDLMKGLDEVQWKKTYFHPGNQMTFSLFMAIKLYDWHCRHHLAHIQLAIESKGKFNN
jgi:hypothetical protein